MSIAVENLANEIRKELEIYSKEVTEVVVNTVDKVAKEVNKEIKEKVIFKQPTGMYVKSFRIDKTLDKKHKRVRTWYVANGHHRLTHLLEYGHAMPHGGRAKAFPHIRFGEELAVKMMDETIRKELEQ